MGPLHAHPSAARTGRARVSSREWEASDPRRFSFRTGQGKLLHGEGVLGFARGFFLAGVPRVIVSQWVVSDESSRALMRRFYEGLATRDLPASAALRAAQRAQLDAGGPWAHPFHGAAFALWGAAN